MLKIKPKQKWQKDLLAFVNNYPKRYDCLRFGKDEYYIEIKSGAGKKMFVGLTEKSFWDTLLHEYESFMSLKIIGQEVKDETCST